MSQDEQSGSENVDLLRSPKLVNDLLIYIQMVFMDIFHVWRILVSYSVKYLQTFHF